MEEDDPKPGDAAAAVEGQRQSESSPGGGGGGGPGDADTGRRRALMLPAALQAPGNHQHPHRITNFFIDNILRPEFGRRKDAGPCCAGAGSEGGAGGADGGGGAGGAEQLAGSGREPRQSAPCAPTAGGPLPGGVSDSPGEGEGGSKALSLHSGAKKGGDPGGPLDGALKARGLGGGDLSLSSDSDSSQASANLGAQPMLWPAWVYCTRYSDRPSSGECAGLEGGAGAGLVGRKKTPGHSFPPTHTKTRTQRHCARLALAGAASRRLGGRTHCTGVHTAYNRSSRSLSLSTFSEPPRTAPCPLPLAGVYLVGWGGRSWKTGGQAGCTTPSLVLLTQSGAGTRPARPQT